MLPCAHPTIDIDRLAVDMLSKVAHEECSKWAADLRLGDLAVGSMKCHPFERCWIAREDLVRQWSADQSWGDGVDSNPQGSKCDAQRSDHCSKSPFGGVVDRMVGFGKQPVDRSGKEQSSLNASFDPMLGKGLCQKETHFDVQVHGAIEADLGNFEERRIDVDPSVGNDDRGFGMLA